VDARRTDALDQWCLRTLLGIKWHQFVQNEEVRRITKQANLTAIIQSRRIWAHCTYGWRCRCQDDPNGSPPENWKRPPGRPRITWLNTINESWEPTTLHWTKQSIWLRTTLCGGRGWFALLVVHARKGEEEEEPFQWPFTRFSWLTSALWRPSRKLLEVII